MLRDRRIRRRQHRDVASQTAPSETTAALPPSATAGSVGSSSRAPSTNLLLTSDANMAWLLANAADVCLRGHERAMTFVELGCGEHHLAIERILNAVISSRMVLSAAMVDRLNRWLDEYADSPHEPRLRRKLAEIRRQQLLTRQVSRGDVGRTAEPADNGNVARRGHV